MMRQVWNVVHFVQQSGDLVIWATPPQTKLPRVEIAKALAAEMLLPLDTSTWRLRRLLLVCLIKGKSLD